MGGLHWARAWRPAVAALAVAAAVLLVPFLDALAAGRPALVVVAAQQGSGAQEHAVMDRFTATMIKRATQGRYAAQAYLTGEAAQKFKVLDMIVKFASRGFEVDVFVMAPGDAEGIVLSGDALDGDGLVAGLQSLQTLKSGGLRFVYTTAGQKMAAAWREAGASAVLSHPGAPGCGMETGDALPLFLPKFILAWAGGDSVTHAAAKASAFSSDFMRALEGFAGPEAAAGGWNQAPVFSGIDMDITGRVERFPWAIEPTVLPSGGVGDLGTQLPRRMHKHGTLKMALLTALARVLATGQAIRPERVPGFSALVESTVAPLWAIAHELYPGRDENQIVIPGGEIRVILERIIPDLDRYLQTLIDQLDSIIITRTDGKMATDIRLVTNSITFPLRAEKKTKTGQPYAVKLDRHTHFEISMRRDSILIDKILGFTAFVKLPIVPDGVYPRILFLDASSEKLTITADAVGGALKVVATADVRAKKFTGVNWVDTIFKNWPLVLSLLFFG